MIKLNANREGKIDILAAIKNIYLPLYLAKSDIRQRYRRSTLGPFWITISTGVMIACLGSIFGTIFKTPLYDFLPFLSAGLILWGFISSTLTEATTVFSSSEPIIKQLPIPLFTHVIRMVARNFYIFLHNLIIFPIVLICVQRPLTWESLYLIPGLAILLLNLLWASLSIGIICSRYRDLTQIMTSILQIFFYVTPIIWMPSALPARASLMVLDPNPFYHFMQILRCPLLGESPTSLNWGITLLITIVGWVFAGILFDKYRSRIAYWL
ncbi:ABC transporter permease [Turicimonas muris]|uniref:ABC transporter permease n=1 Tax=Turicimonas muris TaxID=1796652 RepID=A0A227KRJ4_9BURK|nr:ABC transporter permease [Turicimonas muris]ANU67293.2 ABC transporter permease [Burkholderiales bacterium YL45]OXE51121.1 ABC transporter permease [Turicimonas muris]QQQ96470.1 ABC transporter permease [Turicimonas muris]